MENESVLQMKDRLNVLIRQEKMNPEELKEYGVLCDYFTSLSIERTKKKDGKYDYYVANKDGEIINKLAKFYNGTPLKNDMYLFNYRAITPEYETEDRVVTDHDVHDISEKQGGEDLELFAILNPDGTVLIDGIKEVLSYNYEEDEFILELQSEFHLGTLRKQNTSLTPDNNKPIYCVINDAGEFIVNLTQKTIEYDSLNKEYEVG
jgi:hypothetical protein